MLSVNIAKASARLKHFILLITRTGLAQNAKHYAVKHFSFSGARGDYFVPLDFHTGVAQKNNCTGENMLVEADLNERSL